MWRRTAAGLAIAASACARPPPACSPGYAVDDARVARIERMAGEPEPSPKVVVCFGPRGTPAVVTATTVLLDGTDADVDLAPALAHLLVHVEDGLGDGCARGRGAARASEARARDVEARVRARLHVHSPPLGRDVDADYGARCPW